jgi:hypothetical protein
VIAIALSAWTGGCAATATGTESTPPTPVEDPDAPWLAVEPTSVAFGDVGRGSVATEPIAFTNLGDEPIFVAAVAATTPEVDLSPWVDAEIPAGATIELPLPWRPVGHGWTSERATAKISASRAYEVVTIDVSGMASGRRLSIEPDALDFGAVQAGCSARVPATLRASGDANVQLDDAWLTGPASVVVEVESLPDLPDIIQLDEPVTLWLRYTPTQAEVLDAVLHTWSDDPVTPEAMARVTGTGWVDTVVEDTWTAAAAEPATLLVLINTETGHGDYRPFALEAIEVLLETLEDGGVPFRLAALARGSGIVEGDTPYVDHEYSTGDALDAIEDMLTRSGEDVDGVFDALLAGISQNADWLMDSDGDWDESRLTLVGANGDVEQSRRDATSFASAAQAWKADAADLVFHGIGPAPPRGCGSGAPATAFAEAAALTGGTLFDACATDWTSYGEAIAAAAAPAGTTFDLSALPAAQTLRVFAAGSEVTYGWEYEPEGNRIRFDIDALPAAGTEVRAEYVVQPECPP